MRPEEPRQTPHQRGVAPGAPTPTLDRLAAAAARQSRVSLLATFACLLLLVAVVLDDPVRDLARSLDPSLHAMLLHVTEFGNSAWPLGIGLLLLGAIALVSRNPGRFAPQALQDLRSTLLLMLGSVALSGVTASLSKNIIGRARPKVSETIQVLEFDFMSFAASWASFPSGHATTATACAVALAIAFPRQAWAWLSLGLLTALSRAFLGVHWLTDALAGVALGAVATLILRNRMLKRGHRFQPDATLILPVVGAALREVAAKARSSGRWLSQRGAILLGRGESPR
jgi:membrane-associated phospholipid phosphatase